MKPHVRPALVLICLGVAVLVLQAQQPDLPKPFAGKVVAVADGDTITVLVDRTQHRIRLQHIGAAESGQDFGTKARQALADKVFGKVVEVVWKERDRYQRILGEVHVGDRNISREMGREGWAWHYAHFRKDASFAR